MIYDSICFSSIVPTSAGIHETSTDSVFIGKGGKMGMVFGVVFDLALDLYLYLSKCLILFPLFYNISD